MKTEIMTITPKMAQSWLDGKAENRKIAKHHIKFLADEMLAGRWRLTHQGIAFSEDGKLVDGQHRLAAVIKAAVPIKMMITTDVPIVDFPLFDRGMSRNMSVITGIPSILTESYTFMLALTTGGNKVSPDDVVLLHKQLGGTFEPIMNICKSHRKVYSSAPVRVAAFIAIKTGENSTYVLGTYAKINSERPRDQNARPLVAVAFQNFIAKAIENRMNSGGGAGWRSGIYPRARYTFTQANKDKEQIQVRPVLQERYINECREIVEKILGANPFAAIILKQVQVERERNKQLAIELAATKTAAAAMKINAEYSQTSMEAQN